MVRATPGQKLGVRSPLHDLTALENEDLGGVSDRRYPVGDHEHRPALQESVNRLLHQAVRLRVERRSGFIENEDWRGGEQGPGNRQPLALTPGKARTAIAEERILKAVHPHFD